MRIDLRDAAKTAEELLAGLRSLDGREPDETPTRAARRQRVELTRRLLFLAHLGNRASVQVMEAYHAYKPHDEPASE